jgi:AcrR family transcriptional regulator
MAHRRDDVVACALGLLDRYGLGDLSMRRIAAELDVRPSALYHHFPDKQTLLGAVADRLLALGYHPAPAAEWREGVRAVCRSFRDAMLAYPDGAELVATVRGFGLGARAPYDDLVAVLAAAGLDDEAAAIAATTLLHYVLGHTLHEQTALQAAAAGAVPDTASLPSSRFEDGLALVVAGVGSAQSSSRSTVPPVRQ